MLATFADLCELSRNRPAGEEESGDERVHSPREYFHSYLHSLDVEREGLPEAFRARLAAALRTTASPTWSRAPALEEAVYRVFLAQERAARSDPDRRRPAGAVARRGAELTVTAREEVGEVVERLVVATRLRYPVVGDLARSIRYEVFERPLIEARPGARSYAEASGAPAPARDAPRRRPIAAERIEALVDSPEPLIRLLAEQLTTDGAGHGAPCSRR